MQDDVDADGRPDRFLRPSEVGAQGTVSIADGGHQAGLASDGRGDVHPLVALIAFQSEDGAPATESPGYGRS
ncbi:hypothetical protein [Glycomyces halotolerans]